MLHRALAGEGAEVVGVFVLVDMREVAENVPSTAAAFQTESVEILRHAAANGIHDPAVPELSVDALVNHDDDPRWELIPVAAYQGLSLARSPRIQRTLIP